jgi:protein phosphatase
VYVFRGETLTQLTHDHSWVEEQVRAGTLTPAAARQHPWRNVVTRALSGGEDPDIDVVEIDPVRGERYLLCSDGLFGVVADEQIAQIVNDRSAPLEEICGRLIDAANDAGGPDNITAMLLQVDAP